MSAIIAIIYKTIYWMFSFAKYSKFEMLYQDIFEN